RLEVVVELILELLEELVPNGEIGRRGVDKQHEEENDAVPARQPGANRRSRPRRGSLHTSYASISRDTRRPWCRNRYSSRSNSRTVRSRERSPRVARRATRSSSRSAAFRRRTSDGRPRRSSARIRASNSGTANGLTR